MEAHERPRAYRRAKSDPRAARISGGQAAALERGGKHDGGSRVDLRLLPETADQVLEVFGRARAHLQDVVGLAGDAEAVLDLAELLDTLRKVVGLPGVEGAHRDER